jgi:putative inorganic carbon (hco3(-)) transporter
LQRLHFLTQLFQHPSVFNTATLVALGLVALASCYLLSRVDISVIVVSGLFLQLFSGNWSLMNIPLPLDRLVLVLALVVLVLKGARFVSSRRLVVRPLHLVLLVAAAWAAASGLIAGTITGHLGFYSFLDRFGLVPFALFTLAPLFFGNTKQRSVFLAGLVVIGLYLGLTGVLEGLHAYRFVFPRYIGNPNVGIQFGRARGPILESTGDAFCIFCGGVAAAIGLSTWLSRWARAACYATLVLDAAALFFTLTRSVWIGSFLGVVGAMLLARRARMLVPLLLAGTVAVAATLALSPKIRSEAQGRTESQSPVWDRENTDLAALRIIEEHPLTGVGWENFVNVAPQYMRQQPDYPITGVGLEVHNIFLAHAAELGIPGFLLWFLGLAGATRWAFSRRLPPHAVRAWRQPGPSPPDGWRPLWQIGGVAIVLCFLVIANLVPFSQAAPNALLWTWLGVLAAPYTSEWRALARARNDRLVTIDLTTPATAGSPG